MIEFSDISFADAQISGLKGPSVRFEVQSTSDTPIHPQAVSILDRVFGPWEQPELDNDCTSAPTGRARQLLGWVYRCCKQAEWPVFQLGIFRADGESDVSGEYTLPTRSGPQRLPCRLLMFLITRTLIENPTADHWVEFEQQLAQIQKQMQATGLKGVNQRLILLELNKRNQPLFEVAHDVYQIGTGRTAQLVRGTITQGNGALQQIIQSDKLSTVRLLQAHGIPTVEHQRVYNERQALDAAEALGYPVVLKPFNGTRGFGVICDITTPEQLRWAIGASEASIETCLIEKFYVGDYARVTMMENEFIEIRHIELPRVRGDGRSTLRELIHRYLNSPEHTYVDEQLRTQKLVVDFDHAVKKVHLLRVVRGQGYELDDVPIEGEVVRIGDRISSRDGGSLICWRRVEEIAPEYVRLFSDIQALFGSASIGIDVLCFDPENANRARINEVNFGPMINAYPEMVSAYVDALLARSPQNAGEPS